MKPIQTDSPARPGGCFSDVDVGLPGEFYDLHNCFPKVDVERCFSKDKLDVANIDIVFNNENSIVAQQAMHVAGFKKHL